MLGIWTSRAGAKRHLSAPFPGFVCTSAARSPRDPRGYSNGFCARPRRVLRWGLLSIADRDLPVPRSGEGDPERTLARSRGDAPTPALKRIHDRRPSWTASKLGHACRALASALARELDRVQQTLA